MASRHRACSACKNPVRMPPIGAWRRNHGRVPAEPAADQVAAAAEADDGQAREDGDDEQRD